MALFEPGRVCMKIAGREAGNHCVILEVIDDNFVIVQGPEVRKRRCNIAHLEPLHDRIDIKKDVNKELIKKYNIKLPKKRKKQKVKKEEPVEKNPEPEKGTK